MIRTSCAESNIFFNSKHSLGTPIVSIAGTVVAGTWRPALLIPAKAGTGAGGATRGGTTGTGPRIGADRAIPVLPTGVPKGPAILQTVQV